jgi:long-chain acyl-CoA synthetase
MADFGFWAMAQEEPGHLALVGPDGTELKAGELLGRANQVVHGLRALGLQPGDTIAFVLPNSVEVFEIYLAALQAGWYIVPINHHLVAPEIAYIVKDAEAQVFIGHERFADMCVDAAEEAEIPASRAWPWGTSPDSPPTPRCATTRRPTCPTTAAWATP